MITIDEHNCLQISNELYNCCFFLSTEELIKLYEDLKESLGDKNEM